MTAPASPAPGDPDAPSPPGTPDAPWSCWCQRLDDSALADAYESTPAPQRACVKQCLALLHQLWGEASEENTQTRVDRTLGFAVTESSTPAPWALFVISDDYSAPTRLAAALMPALLARVPHVAVLCVGGMPSVGTRLALELAGIQDIFCAAQASAAEDLVRGLCSRVDAPRGCVALLHHGALACVASTAKALGAALWEEAAAPSILDATGDATGDAVLQGSCATPHMKAQRSAARRSASLVRLCHPDASAPNLQEAPENSRCDAVFGTPPQETVHTLTAPLRIAEGMEGFWLHPSLTPAFFRRHQWHMTTHTGEHPWAQT